MRLITAAGFAAALALSASPALAAKTSAKDQTLAQEGGSAAEASERKICKRMENTGTRMKNDRVCLTKSEWRKLDDMQ
jgi:Spy/CpxP family protein refolding chaperone